MFIATSCPDGLHRNQRVCTPLAQAAAGKLLLQKFLVNVSAPGAHRVNHNQKGQHYADKYNFCGPRLRIRFD
jgi:hypothetical protein